MNLDKYTIDQATHNLSCRHQIGRNGYDYTMPCVVIGKPSPATRKIIVFGERCWAHREHIKHIRYVNVYKLRERKKQ